LGLAQCSGEFAEYDVDISRFIERRYHYGKAIL